MGNYFGCQTMGLNASVFIVFVRAEDTCKNEMNRAFVHISAKLGQENLLRMVR